MLKKLFDRAFRRGKANTSAVTTAVIADDVPIRLDLIPRDQHNISRRDISPNALRVLYKLREGGFESYLVGGAVRDLLLGGHPKDFDVATSAHPDQVKQLFRNCRLIGRRFRLAHVHYGQEIIEVATFRGTADDGSGAREMVDGRIVRDNVYGTIEEDAVRRDFTINALYYTIDDFSVHDFVGGYADVQQRVLRLIGAPERRFREDPVRMLRAARFAAKLGFSIEASAAAAITSLRHLIADAPPARLFDESLKLFLAGHALSSFRVLREQGLMDSLLPDFESSLAADPSLQSLIESALRNTDERVAAGKSVTPAFLFAALLWPAVTQTLAASGNDDVLSASQHVVGKLLSLVALPKRFSLPMQEIWIMQSRLDARQRKRSGRLLAHPRFRAAYDFLLLRSMSDPSLRATVAFWQSLQSGQPADETLPSIDVEFAKEGDVAAPKKRRRRRRKPTEAGASTPTPQNGE